MTPKLILENVSKRYGDTSILSNINLTVEEGEFLVLVGPSGCGKTTTLRLISGLETLSEGDIRLEGKSVQHLAPKDRDIAMVFQNYALYPHMSVYDNMAFGLKMRKTPKAVIQQEVAKAAERLQLQALLKRKPKELSGGQRQRVALGRAIVRHPKVFLMDEPLSNLDAKLRQHMRYELASLHQALNATTLYVTHDQTEALTLGHRLVVFHQGKIQQADTPKQVYEKPANRFVASFIGQMNLLPLQVRDGQLFWQVDAGQAPLCVGQASLLGAQSSKGEVLLGFRPEAVELMTPHEATTMQEGYLHLPLTLQRFEMLGSEKLLYAVATVLAGMDAIEAEVITPIQARVPAYVELHAGQALGLRIAAHHLHCFANTEQGDRLF
jgi:multiple sugar transport system ATP-binding protein